MPEKPLILYVWNSEQQSIKTETLKYHGPEKFYVFHISQYLFINLETKFQLIKW